MDLPNLRAIASIGGRLKLSGCSIVKMRRSAKTEPARLRQITAAPSEPVGCSPAMCVPNCAHHQERQRVDRQSGCDFPDACKPIGMGRLQLEHQKREDDGVNAVSDQFEPVFVHVQRPS